MSETPRTDSAYGLCIELDARFPLVEESKKLERELNATKEKVKRLEEAGKHLRQTSSDKRACDAWDKLKGTK